MSSDRKHRVVTEARREQNRRAQRVYRTRQKQLQRTRSVPLKSPDATPPTDDVLTDEALFDIFDESILSLSSPEMSLSPSVPPIDPSATFFGAMLHNALHIDLDLAALASCNDDLASPFFKPLTPQCSLPSADTHGHLPPNLRPTPAQVLIPHHASFDLIPIPEFRERAIMLSAAMPHMFNLKELKIDIHVREGMAVKGGYTWDEKCWQVKPWFVKKWCMLINGT